MTGKTEIVDQCKRNVTVCKDANSVNKLITVYRLFPQQCNISFNYLYEQRFTFCFGIYLFSVSISSLNTKFLTVFHPTTATSILLQCNVSPKFSNDFLYVWSVNDNAELVKISDTIWICFAHSCGSPFDNSVIFLYEYL